MSKVQYVLKVWMFRSQFKLTLRKKRDLREIPVFVSRLFGIAWTLTSRAPAAPRHDMQLLKDSTTYMDVNQDVGKAAMTKLQGHLW